MGSGAPKEMYELVQRKLLGRLGRSRQMFVVWRSQWRHGLRALRWAAQGSCPHRLEVGWVGVGIRGYSSSDCTSPTRVLALEPACVRQERVPSLLSFDHKSMNR